MGEYEPLGDLVTIGGSPGLTFPFAAEWRDITSFGDDQTTWRIRQREGAGPACSFRAWVGGRDVFSSVHPIPATEALKQAMLAAVREDLGWLVGNGQAPSAEHPVVDREVWVTAGHLERAGWVAGEDGEGEERGR